MLMTHSLVRRRRAGALLGTLGLGLALGSAPGPSAAGAFDHRHWGQILQRYVDDDGRVAYKDLAARDRATLDAYLRDIAGADPESWAPDEQKAFWINAYNAGIFAAVLEGYSAETFLGRVSLFKRFVVDVAGARRTLDEIEHGIIRPRFRDPRTHFALVCASSSCPRLRPRAYAGPTIDAALDEETRRFVNDAKRNLIDPASRSVKLSAIFDWFADDFAAAAGSVGAYVARYVEGDAKSALVQAATDDVTYLDYDWTMNAQKDQRP